MATTQTPDELSQMGVHFEDTAPFPSIGDQELSISSNSTNTDERGTISSTSSTSACQCEYCTLELVNPDDAWYVFRHEMGGMHTFMLYWIFVPPSVLDVLERLISPTQSTYKTVDFIHSFSNFTTCYVSIPAGILYLAYFAYIYLYTPEWSHEYFIEPVPVDEETALLPVAEVPKTRLACRCGSYGSSSAFKWWACIWIVFFLCKVVLWCESRGRVRM